MPTETIEPHYLSFAGTNISMLTADIFAEADANKNRDFAARYRKILNQNVKGFVLMSC